MQIDYNLQIFIESLSYSLTVNSLKNKTQWNSRYSEPLKRGGCLFTQSHADHVIGLQDERSLMKANNVLGTALANGRSSVFSSTGKAAY